jgi:hypothetical protein
VEPGDGNREASGARQAREKIAIEEGGAGQGEVRAQAETRASGEGRAQGEVIR